MDYQRIFDREKHQRFYQALSDTYLDIIVLCTEFKDLLLSQKQPSVKRIFQPLSTSLNVHLDGAVARFRRHCEEVDKQTEVCHMIEAREARDLVKRNIEAAEARERCAANPLSKVGSTLMTKLAARQEKLVSQLSSTDHRSKHRRM